MSTQPLLIASNDVENPVVRLVAVLKMHGFENVTVDDESSPCVEDDIRPQIPVIRFSGKDKAEVEALQGRLTDLVLEFYDDHQDGRELDTQLAVLESNDRRRVQREVVTFDQNIDRDVEFDFELSFGGLKSLVTMPRELFERSPGFGRTIFERYCAKLDRFAAFLESPQALAFTLSGR